VLANLVSNALDAAPIDGVGHVEIQLLAHPAAADRPAHISIMVSDNGSGIDPAVRERLFEPFTSTKGDLGNGLGLYISREIVERHGGSIAMDSQPGHGTRVTFWLPSE
jgi:signal transduction histidine kinase